MMAIRSRMLTMLLAAVPALAVAAQTDNRGIHAVPVPTTGGEAGLIIDGDLADWDLSGQVLICYDLEALQEIYSARVAMMYDAEALYVAVDWTDPRPLGNRHDPRHEAGKGWAGDALQLRIMTDRIAHLTAWYYGPNEEPYIGIDYGKSLTEPFGGGGRSLYQLDRWQLDHGAVMAFLRHADGRGYVQEMKIPWALITHERRYTPGESFRCGIELLWGEGDWPAHRFADNLSTSANNREFFWSSYKAWGEVLLEPEGRLDLPQPGYLKNRGEPELAGPVEIAYDLPLAAQVTLAIDDAAGQRVRNLIAAQARTAGRNLERWDGLDDQGRPVPIGDYRVRGLYHQGIRLEYAMSFANPGRPGWDTPDNSGAFYADHTPPQAAAAAPEGDFVALGCPLGESGRHLIAVDLDGQRQWGLHNRQGFVIGTRASRISLATDGRILWVGNASNDTVYRVDIATGEYAPWDRVRKDEAGREVRELDLRVSEWTPGEGQRDWVNLSGIACRDGVVAVALRQEGLIRLLDAQTGEVQAELEVASPRAVAIEAGGGVVALADGRLVRIDRAGQVTRVNDGDWSAGYGLVLDRDGRIYLSVREPDHNVKVFSAEGEQLREIGERGGRPHHGPFTANAMRKPGHIAIDSLGRLWVPEETRNPKRTSVWSLEGELLEDFAGTTSYAGAGSINPHQPTMAFSNNTVYQIDLEEGAWRPVYSLGGRGLGNELFPPSADSRTRVIERDGRTYVFATTNRHGAVGAITQDGDGQWRSTAAVGVVQSGNHHESGIKQEHPWMRSQVGKAYAWADRNGDGIVSEDELTFARIEVDGATLELASSWWGTLPGTDGTVTYLTRGGKHVVQFAIREWTASGSPVYDIEHPRIHPLTVSPGGGMVMGGSDGRTYLNTSPLTGIDVDGKMLFTYPSPHVGVHGSHHAGASRPGYLIGPLSVLGTADLGDEIGEVFSLNGNLGENYLFTHDGLWIQSLFRDTRGWFETPGQAVPGMSMDAVTAGGECFGGNFIRTRDGDVYLTMGQTEARVLRVVGLDSIRRFGGEIAYTQRQFVEAQRQHEAQVAAAAEPREASLARTDTPPGIDGRLADWPVLAGATAGGLPLGEARRPAGHAAAVYDAEHLYVAWRVRTPTPEMRNAGQDERLLFKTGDAVDLMLGPDPADEQGNNLRLLIAPMAGVPTAMLYQSRVPGTADADRVPFSSPWRTVHMDRVTRPPDVKVAIAAAPDGYVVEAAIPWRVLGVTPGAGKTFRGDFGALAADSGGTITVARRYWSNTATGLVNDVPGEAELTPGRWARITLE